MHFFVYQLVLYIPLERLLGKTYLKISKISRGYQRVKVKK